MQGPPGDSLQPEAQLNYLVAQYGADHILIGTDYPADMGETDPVGTIEATPGLDDVENAGQSSVVTQPDC